MDDLLTDAVVSHVTKHIGAPTRVLHELIPDDLHIDIHVVEPTEQRPFYTLVTSGMSEKPMTTPGELEGAVTPHVELTLCLPPQWNLNAESQDEHSAWPVNWMRLLAKYPHDYNTWLYVSHTVPNGDPAEPLAPNTDLCCWFVRVPQTVDEAFLELNWEGRAIGFLGLTPIYQSEMEFAMGQPPETLFALDQALEAAGVTELVDGNRPPVC